MTVEEGIKMVVSGGIVTPPDRRPEDQKGIVKVAPADGDSETILDPETEWHVAELAEHKKASGE
jgi:uncharacterized membrane protein